MTDQILAPGDVRTLPRAASKEHAIREAGEILVAAGACAPPTM